VLSYQEVRAKGGLFGDCRVFGSSSMDIDSSFGAAQLIREPAVDVVIRISCGGIMNFFDVSGVVVLRDVWQICLQRWT
jgi:hypothetical protein